MTHPRSITLFRLVAVSLLLASPSAHAAEGYGSDFYASVFAGGSFASDAEFSGTIGGASQTVENDYESGYAVGGALGKSWGKLGGFAVRTEIELSYRENDVGGIHFSGNGPEAEINVSGSSSSTSLLGNVLVDFPIAGFPVTR